MIDLDTLRKRFPHYTIRSQPDSNCTCENGVRETVTGHEFPCLCVCMSAPGVGEDEYRSDLCKAVGNAAKNLGGKK